jgi:hypothetical protein
VVALVVLLHVVALAVAIVYPMVGRRPLRTVRLGDTDVELWVRERRLPRTGEGIVVPVAPDLKMVFGIAKWVRDATADVVQRQAERVAPLEPGEVFIGGGGRYKFGYTALAVVMDDQKIAPADWIARGVINAIIELRDRGADVIILPDFTEDLLRQPQTITPEQRQETCRPVARAMMDGVVAASDNMQTVRIWVWRKEYADIYAAEMDRLRTDVQHGLMPAHA